MSARVVELMESRTRRATGSLRAGPEVPPEACKQRAQPEFRQKMSQALSFTRRMKVSFEPAARDELDRIFVWIAKESPRAALEMIARIETKMIGLRSRGS